MRYTFVDCWENHSLFMVFGQGENGTSERDSLEFREAAQKHKEDLILA
jgi:hypothetical protein